MNRSFETALLLFFSFGATPPSYSQAIDQPPVLSRSPFEDPPALF